MAAAALLAPAPTEATTLQELSLAAMVRQADVIVTGSCERVESRWVGRRLLTLATVSVSETLKGEARRELTLVIPGGMDLKRPIPIAVTYPGAPVVMPGQGLVLLLEPSAEIADGFAAVGFSQGALPVMRDEAGRSLVLRRGASAGGAVPLAALRSEILSYLEAQR
jgi:hypothetical protein